MTTYVIVTFTCARSSERWLHACNVSATSTGEINTAMHQSILKQTMPRYIAPHLPWRLFMFDGSTRTQLCQQHHLK